MWRVCNKEVRPQSNLTWVTFRKKAKKKNHFKNKQPFSSQRYEKSFYQSPWTSPPSFIDSRTNNKVKRTLNYTTIKRRLPLRLPWGTRSTYSPLRNANVSLDRAKVLCVANGKDAFFLTCFLFFLGRFSLWVFWEAFNRSFAARLKLFVYVFAV